MKRRQRELNAAKTAWYSGVGSAPAEFASAATPRFRAGSKAIIALKPPVIPLCQMTLRPPGREWCQARPISPASEGTPTRLTRGAR